MFPANALAYLTAEKVLWDWDLSVEEDNEDDDVGREHAVGPFEQETDGNRE